MYFKRVIVFLLLTAVGCRQQVSIISPTYTNLPAADSARMALVENWKNQQPPILTTSQNINTDWHYVAGANESLNTFRFPAWDNGELINLPHRITLPNSPMWYQWQLTNDIDSAVMLVNADDGAQAFLNGQALQRVIDDRFYLRAKTGDTLVIRVLNNAMAGGLREVKLATMADYRVFEKSMTIYRRSKSMMDQVRRLNVVSADIVEAANRVFEHVSDENLRRLDSLLAPYPLLSHPVLLNNKGRFQLNWLSTSNADLKIWTGSTPEHLITELRLPTKKQPFRLDLSDLGEARFYRINQLETWSEVFQVPQVDTASTTENFSFSLWADSQGGWEIFSELMSQTNEYDDKFSLGAGDLVANGSDSIQWKSLLASLGQAKGRFPFYLVPGNHDYDGYYDDLSPKNFNKYITTPSGKNYFSWQYANCAFIAIDPNEAFPIGFSASDQKQWFMKELENPAWKGATWHFVVLHQPPFSQGWPGYQGDEVVRELLDSVYESADVDFVITGHTHDYERLTKEFDGHQVHFLIVGGAGGGLEPEGEMSDEPETDVVIKRHHLARMFVHGDSIRLEVKDPDQTSIDQFDFIKQ